MVNTEKEFSLNINKCGAVSLNNICIIVMSVVLLGHYSRILMDKTIFIICRCIILIHMNWNEV